MNNPDNSSQRVYHMDDVIDLRPYLLDLLQSWKLIIGIPLIIGIVVFVYFRFFTTPVYEATSLVAVTSASLSVDVATDFRVRTNDNFIRSQDVYPELALSDSLIDQLYNDPAVQSVLPSYIDEADDLESYLSVPIGSDASLIRLTANFPEEELPVIIVNRWAEIVIENLNQTYGTSNEQALANLESRLAAAEQDRIDAERTLADFQLENREPILSARLSSYTTTQSINIDELQTLDRTLIDLESFKEQIDAGDIESFNASTLFLFELQVYGPSERSNSVLHIDNLNAVDQEVISASDATRQIDSLLLFVQTKKRNLSNNIDEIENLILDTRRELELAKSRSRSLTDRLSLTEETYSALALKVEEERIATDIFDGQIRIASFAVNSSPVSNNRLISTIVSVIATGLLVVAYFVLRRWWVNLFASS